MDTCAGHGTTQILPLTGPLRANPQPAPEPARPRTGLSAGLPVARPPGPAGPQRRCPAPGTGARCAGVNEVLAVLLLAAKSGVPVCPHAGGVGLCEYVQHLAMFDYIGVSASFDGRIVEWVDHLHEHFRDPAVVRSGRYLAPTAPGYSIEMLPNRWTSTSSPMALPGEMGRL